MIGRASVQKLLMRAGRLGSCHFAWHNLNRLKPFLARSGDMYFEQFYLTCLAHASYMIGSEGEAAVVDPQRDVEIYLKAAAEQHLKIRHISKRICMPILFLDTKNWRRARAQRFTLERRRMPDSRMWR